MTLYPKVAINTASSLNGCIQSHPNKPCHFSSRYDRQYMRTIRARYHAVLIGAETLRIDNPPLTAAEDSPLQPVAVIVSQSGNIPSDSRVFKHASSQRVVIVTAQSHIASQQQWPPHVDFIFFTPPLDWSWLLAQLYNMGISRLLVEGGSQIWQHFWMLGRVDEIYITLCPVLFGQAELASWFPPTGTMQQLQLLDCHPVNDELFCHYRVVR
jgi:riboflavin-specific deaminase-like protein